MSHRIDYCGEGALDAVLARRLIRHVGGEPGINYVDRRKPRGKQAVDQRIPGLLAASRHGARILLLRDLDEDAPCAAALAARLLPQPQGGFCLRIAVHAAEAWLMADRPGLAKALRLPVRILPLAPEQVLRPKARLSEIAAQSADRACRSVFAGGPQQSAGWLAEFITDRWNIHRACETAPSLSRAIVGLQQLLV